MTRLHIQVNQTVQFYRGQQGGSAPERLYLSGGGSIMPYTAQFFAEKLNLPVDYFNPFRNIEIDPSLDLEELSKYAHSFGEVVGLGLRDLAHCPVELNLMPKSSIQRQEFAQKKPYFIAAVFSLALAVFLLDRAQAKLADGWHTLADGLKGTQETMTSTEQQLNSAIADRDSAVKNAQDFILVSQNHVYWANILGELRRILIQAEQEQSAALAKANGGTNVDTGVWIDLFDPELPLGSVFSGNVPEAGGEYMPINPTRLPSRFGTNFPGRNPPPRPAAAPVQGGSSTSAVGSISSIRMICRLVDHTRLSPSANKEMAYAVKSIVEASTNYFTKAELGDKGIEPDNNGDTNTFTFRLTVTLKNPFKL